MPETPTSIPVIGDAEIVRRLETVRPVVMHAGRLWWIEIPDVRNTAFTWEPRRTAIAAGLRYVGSVRTLHTYGAPVLFKPSIAEVLAQIPDRPDIAAFLVEGPEDVADLNREHAALDAGFHVATTLLFARE